MSMKEHWENEAYNDRCEITELTEQIISLREILASLLPGYEQYIEWAEQRGVFGLEQAKANLLHAHDALKR